MKKVFILVSLSLAVFTASAKHGGGEGAFKIGLGGAFNSTWLFNTNLSNMGDQINYTSTTGGQFGLSATYDFNENIGLASGLFYTMHNQKYDLGKGIAEVETKLNYLDIPILFRAGNLTKGFYFEIGPQIGILMGGKEDVTVPDNPAVSYTGRDFKSQYNSFDFAGVLGFGGIFDLSDNLAMSAGLRLGWSFTDVTTVQYTQDQWKDLNGQKPETLSWTEYLAHASYKTDPVTHFNLLDYKPTNRAFGGVFVSILYKLQ